MNAVFLHPLTSLWRSTSRTLPNFSIPVRATLAKAQRGTLCLQTIPLKVSDNALLHKSFWCHMRLMWLVMPQCGQFTLHESCPGLLGCVSNCLWSYISLFALLGTHFHVPLFVFTVKYVTFTGNYERNYEIQLVLIRKTNARFTHTTRKL